MTERVKRAYQASAIRVLLDAVEKANDWYYNGLDRFDGAPFPNEVEAALNHPAVQAVRKG